MSQDLEKPLAEIRIYQDSEEMKWSTASQAELLDEEMEDMDDEEENMYDSYDRVERENLSEDLARIKLVQYLEGLEKDDRLVNFATRVDIEQDVLEAWKPPVNSSSHWSFIFTNLHRIPASSD